MKSRASVLALAVAAVAAVAVVASGCGTQPAVGGVNADDVSASLDGLVIRLAGGADERNAAAKLEDQAFQGGYADCMAQRGFTYPRRPFAPPEIDEQVTPHRGTEWLEPLAEDFGIARFKVAYRAWGADWKDSPFYDLSVEERRAYDKALGKCANAEQQWTMQAEPETARSLRDGLTALLSEADATAATRGEEYAACLADRGFEADTFSDLYRLVWVHFPKGLSAPTSVSEGDAAWKEAVAYEHAAAAADAECRGDIYSSALVTLGDQVDEFVAEHDADLTAVDQEWQAVVNEAQSLS